LKASTFINRDKSSRSCFVQAIDEREEKKNTHNNNNNNNNNDDDDDNNNNKTTKQNKTKQNYIQGQTTTI
jgi:hypothetical protein